MWVDMSRSNNNPWLLARYLNDFFTTVLGTRQKLNAAMLKICPCWLPVVSYQSVGDIWLIIGIVIALFLIVDKPLLLILGGVTSEGGVWVLLTFVRPGCSRPEWACGVHAEHVTLHAPFPCRGAGTGSILCGGQYCVGPNVHQEIVVVLVW